MYSHYDQAMINCAITLLQLKYGELSDNDDIETDELSDNDDIETDELSDNDDIETDELSDNDELLVTCDCGHQWDGYAQCMCLGIINIDEFDEIIVVKTHKMILRSQK